MTNPKTKDLEYVYDMLPAQKRLRETTSPFVLMSGGYGSGKTYALCNEGILLSAENAGMINGLVGPSIPSLKKDILPTIEEILATNNIQYEYHASTKRFDKMIEIPLWNGFIQLASGDDPRSMKGPTWASVGFNEPGIMKAEVWEVGISRVRAKKATNPKIYACGTPEGYNWLYDEFIKNPSKDHEVIYADTRENIHNREGYAKRLLTNFDKPLIQEKVEGRFVDTKRSRVYHAFDMEQTVKGLEYEPNLPIVFTWDFNVNPMCTAICQVHRDEVWVIDEIVIETSNTMEVCHEFIRRYGAYGKDHKAGIYIYGDASGRAKTTKTDDTDYSIIRQMVGHHFSAYEFYIEVPAANPAVSDRINAVNAMLENSEGLRRIFVDDRCAMVRESFTRTVYKAGTGGIDKKQNIEHITDALGYFVYRQFTPFADIGNEGGYIEEPIEEGSFAL